MSPLTRTFICTSAILLASLSMKAEDEVKISKQDFEHLWVTKVAVAGEVESYTPGKGDALVYEYDGHMHPNSDSIAVVKIITDEKPPTTKKLRVSVPNGESAQLKLLRQPGSKMTFFVPQLFVKYDPWGFVPFNELKQITQVAPEKSGTGKPSGSK